MRLAILWPDNVNGPKAQENRGEECDSPDARNRARVHFPLVWGIHEPAFKGEAENEGLKEHDHAKSHAKDRQTRNDVLLPCHNVGPAPVLCVSSKDRNYNTGFGTRLLAPVFSYQLNRLF